MAPGAADGFNARARHARLVNAVTDALLAGETGELAGIAARYAVPPAQVRRYARLISSLHRALVGARPSPAFVRALKSDLLGGAAAGERRRKLLARVPQASLALAMAALAGALLTATARRWRRRQGRAVNSPGAG